MANENWRLLTRFNNCHDYHDISQRTKVHLH